MRVKFTAPVTLRVFASTPGGTIKVLYRTKDLVYQNQSVVVGYSLEKVVWSHTTTLALPLDTTEPRWLLVEEIDQAAKRLVQWWVNLRAQGEPPLSQLQEIESDLYAICRRYTQAYLELVPA